MASTIVFILGLVILTAVIALAGYAIIDIEKRQHKPKKHSTHKVSHSHSA